MSSKSLKYYMAEVHHKMVDPDFIWSQGQTFNNSSSFFIWDVQPLLFGDPQFCHASLNMTTQHIHADKDSLPMNQLLETPDTAGWCQIQFLQGGRVVQCQLQNLG